MTLGARLRTLRKARGLTQRALAGEDLSGSFISMVEHDRVRPSLATLRLLAERLQEPLSALLADEGEHPLLLEAHLSHGDALLVRHEFTRAVEEYQAALRGAERLADPRLGTRAHLGLAQALTGLHHFDLAEPHLAAADEGAAALGDALLAAQAANARGIMELRRRDFPAARRALQRALDHLRSAPAEDRALTGRVWGNLGRVYLNLGLPLQAEECFRAAEAALRAAADPETLGLLHYHTGMVCLQHRAWTEATRHLTRAAECFQLQENLQLLGIARRSLAIVHLDRGAPAEAEPLLRQSLVIAEQVADDVGRAQTLTELARTAAALGRTDEADGHAREALRLAERVGDPAEAARARAALGAVARLRGDAAAARGHFHAAAEAFRRLGMSRELSEALRDLGFAYLEEGKEGEAARAFAEAFTAQRAAAAAGA